MKKYLIDTGVLSAYLRGRQRIVAMIRPWLAQDELVTSIVVYGEIVEYLKSQTDYQQRKSDLLALLNDVTPLSLDYAIEERYADIRRMLRPPHGAGIIGDIDTLIAATALEHNLTLITADSDFIRVPGLSINRIDRTWLKA